jgi:thiol:disulfide interchange protein DsbD
VRVKKAFGFVLLAMALSFAKPILGETAHDVGLAFIVLAALGGILFRGTGRGGVLRRVAATGVAVGALVSLGVLPASVGSAPDWVAYSAGALEKARSEGRPVMIDFYADWCLPCKELDALTFSRPEVREAARRIAMVKADVMLDSTEASRDGLNRFAVEGVPTVVFLDGQGQERRDLRVAAFVRSPQMLERMTALSASAPQRQETQ